MKEKNIFNKGAVAAAPLLIFVKSWLLEIKININFIFHIINLKFGTITTVVCLYFKFYLLLIDEERY